MAKLVEASTELPKDEVTSYPNASSAPYIRFPDSPTYNGAFGSVSEYRDAFNNAFAVKEIRLETGKRDESRRRKSQTTLLEVKILRELRHPNLLEFVTMYKLDTIPNTLFLVTIPWAPTTLGDFLHSGEADKCMLYPPWNDLSPFRRCIIFYAGLIDGMRYIHDMRILHKDVKPENILVEIQDKEIRPILIDFGISKMYYPEDSTKFTNSTFSYLAPEQISHTESGLKADVFALGCCFLLIYAAAYGGSNALNKILDIVYKEPASCQYGRELARLFPALRSIIPKAPDLMFFVRDMLVETPKNRPDCTLLYDVLNSIVKQQGEPRSEVLLRRTRWNLVWSQEADEMLNLYRSPTHFDRTDNALITKALGIDMVIEDPFVREATIIEQDTRTWIRPKCTLDTMSDFDLISDSLLQKLETHTKYRRTVLKDPITLQGLGPLVWIASTSVRLKIAIQGSNGYELDIDFLILPGRVITPYQLLLGRKALSRHPFLLQTGLNAELEGAPVGEIDVQF